MSDRREAVARGIRLERYRLGTIEMDDESPMPIDYRLADAAIAAMQAAEPTDAEIGTAFNFLSKKFDIDDSEWLGEMAYELACEMIAARTAGRP